MLATPFHIHERPHMPSTPQFQTDPSPFPSPKPRRCVVSIRQRKLCNHQPPRRASIIHIGTNTRLRDHTFRSPGSRHRVRLVAGSGIPGGTNSLIMQPRPNVAVAPPAQYGQLRKYHARTAGRRCVPNQSASYDEASRDTKVAHDERTCPQLWTFKPAPSYREPPICKPLRLEQQHAQSHDLHARDRVGYAGLRGKLEPGHPVLMSCCVALRKCSRADKLAVREIWENWEPGASA